MFADLPLTVTYVERGRVRLERAVTWVDDEGMIVVPVGFQSDGVTSPPWSWPMLGHPYSGSLLRPAILHDYEIWTKRAPWSTVHRRFYRALRANGVGRVRAALLFAGVYLGGPRWEPRAESPS